MLDTSAIRGILWLVLRSEDAYPAVNGVDMYQLVSQSLMQEYKTRKKGRKRAFLISETYFIDLRPFDYTDVLVLWGNPRWDNLSCLDFIGLVSATKRKVRKRIISNDNRDFKVQRRNGNKNVACKSQFTFFQSLWRLFLPTYFVSWRRTFLNLNFRGTYLSSEREIKFRRCSVYVLFSFLPFLSLYFSFNWSA